MTRSLGWASQVVKNLPAIAEDTRDLGSVSELGRSSGGENDNPLQYSCLENPMDRRSWQVTAHGVGKEWDLTQHTRREIAANYYIEYG